MCLLTSMFSFIFKTKVMEILVNSLKSNQDRDWLWLKLTLNLDLLIYLFEARLLKLNLGHWNWIVCKILLAELDWFWLTTTKTWWSSMLSFNKLLIKCEYCMHIPFVTLADISLLTFIIVFGAVLLIFRIPYQLTVFVFKVESLKC